LENRIIRAGAATETEMNEKKDLVEGALHATSAYGGGTYRILRLVTQEVERVRLVLG
jgi:hypothetical protein